MIVFSATDQPAYGYSCDGDGVELYSVPKDQQTSANNTALGTSLEVSEGHTASLDASLESSVDGLELYASNPTDECDDNDISLHVNDDSIEIVESSGDVLPDIEQASCSIEVDYHTGPHFERESSVGSYNPNNSLIPVGVIDNTEEEENDEKGISVINFIARREAWDDIEETKYDDDRDEENGSETWSEKDQVGEKARRRPRLLGFLAIALLMVVGAIVALAVGLLANRSKDGVSAETDSTASLPETGIFGEQPIVETIFEERPGDVQSEAPASDESSSVPTDQSTSPSGEQPVDDVQSDTPVSYESASDESSTVPTDQPTSPSGQQLHVHVVDEELPPQTKEDLFIYPNAPSSTIPDHIAHVIHIVVDGLRPDYMNGPNFDRLKSEGACTLNARHDWASSQTLPNHIGMFVGLVVADHGYKEDLDNGGQLINPATGQGFENIFDLVKDAGGTTAFFGSKEKFALFDRSWPIDTFVFQKRGMFLIPLFLEDMNSKMYNYAFLHIRNPDRAGHKDSGGATAPVYSAEVAEADAYLGQVFDLVESNSELLDNTAIVLTADHGFADVGNHADRAMLDNYRIPFCTHGPGVIPGTDLIKFNSHENGGVVVDPGTSRGQEGDRIIRNSYSGVLSADWLGLRPSTGAFSDRFVRYR